VTNALFVFDGILSADLAPVATLMTGDQFGGEMQIAPACHLLQGLDCTRGEQHDTAGKSLLHG